MNTSFNVRLRKIKEENGYSSKRLAGRLNVTVRTVNSWLNGDSQPKADQVYRIAEIFGITPNELFYDKVDNDSMDQLTELMFKIPEERRRDAMSLMVDLFKVAIPHVAH